MKRYLIFSLVFIILSEPGCGSNKNSGLKGNPPWPKFRGNIRNTGLSTVNTYIDTGMHKWSYPTGSFIYSSPAVGANGTIYVGSHDNNLYAIH
ncbi:MAG: PQQ-binding-like beta-propeller repeat protein [Deltaproteobacteria bacterium]|nr:PQQ-binding-like beta-propeller repeat protein [Deltaproteobacteria bacterium]MCL5792509.1 PQQ-binding-like beta-propeller repeat protein [Deltaproteobacteria bacterium]